MQIAYTKHSEGQLLERNISKSTVEKALVQPDETIVKSNGQIIAHKLLFLGKTRFLLRVFYSEEFDTKRVLTAYLTTKIDKYYRKGLK